MKIVVISDTHGKHEELGHLSGDVLIHCGDMEHLFERDGHAIRKMDDWFGRQQFDHVICTGGNHDLALEQQVRGGVSPVFRNASFLNEAELAIDGVRFFGAPWVPDLVHHAFFASDAALERAWFNIPDDVDVLITHTPPAGILDVSRAGLHLGCPHLKNRLKAVRPKLHCFGHVHASAGSCRRRGTTFVNASSVNSNFEISRSPFEFEMSNSGARRRKWGRWTA